MLDFGWIEPLTTANESFTLRNAGFADLDITNTLVIANEFVQIDSLSLPVTLAPGEEGEGWNVLFPLTLGQHVGEFYVQNSSLAPTIMAQMEGGASDQPIAVCSVNPEETVLLEEVLIGWGKAPMTLVVL